MDVVDKILDSVDAYLLRFIIEERVFSPLETTVSKNSDAYQLERIRISQKMNEDMYYHQMLDFTFIYTTIHDELIFVPNQQKVGSAVNWNWRDVRSALSDFFLSQQYEERFEQRWFDMKINEDYYLMRVIRSGKLYMGMGIQVDNLLGPMQMLDLGDHVISLFTNELNEPLKNDHRQAIDYSFVNDSYKLTSVDNQDYLIVGKASSKGSFNLVALVPDKVILEKLPFLLRVTYLIAGAFALIVVIAVFALRKIVLLPIHRLLFAMRKAKEGSLDVRIPAYRSSTEFRIMNDTFNDMVEEIQQLKIEIYEEQLAKQQAELKQLQLQINPHFFLNSLNIVYYLAKDKKYALIQDLSLSLIQYFRFMFRSGADVVPLSDEIKHTENYLRIQTFRFPHSLTYQTEVEETLLSVPLPPLIIQTFVENSVKYAIDTDHSIHIQITAEQVSSDRLRIRIRDTGKGFPDQMLQMLQNDEIPSPANGEKIGIWNVTRRLELLYGGQATITFSNDNGAVVEIVMPLKQTDA
jgi:two-component system sensor histidine kinase YesM